MNATCFFIGHRDAPEGIYSALREAVERHIADYGVSAFLVGQYGNFDRMAARAVIEAKQRHKVTLLLLLPYHPFHRPVQTPPGFDGTYYPPGMETVPNRAAIARANRAAVEGSDYLIAYDAGRIGNTRTLVSYARRREKQGLIRVENLAQIMS